VSSRSQVSFVADSYETISNRPVERLTIATDDVLDLNVNRLPSYKCTTGMPVRRQMPTYCGSRKSSCSQTWEVRLVGARPDVDAYGAVARVLGKTGKSVQLEAEGCVTSDVASQGESTSDEVHLSGDCVVRRNRNSSEARFFIKVCDDACDATTLSGAVELRARPAPPSSDKEQAFEEVACDAPSSP
jgi:hypothetical protein